MQDLSGYAPEVPEEGGFEAFKFNGWASVEKAVVSVNESVDSEYYPMGCNQIEIEVTVMEEPCINRKLWKRFNLDSEKEDKKGKTSAKKLADQLFAVGLTFKTLGELKEVVEKFVGMDIVIKAWAADFKDGRDKVQMWNIKGLKAGDRSTSPTGTPKF